MYMMAAEYMLLNRKIGLEYHKLELDLKKKQTKFNECGIAKNEYIINNEYESN